MKLAGIKVIIGHTYTKMNQFKDAETCLNEALDIFKKVKGDNSIDCSEIYCHLGDLMAKKGEFDVG